MEDQWLESPLEKNLGFMGFERYKLSYANSDPDFTKLNGTWNQYIYSSRTVNGSETYEIKDNDDANEEK